MEKVSCYDEIAQFLKSDIAMLYRSTMILFSETLLRTKSGLSPFWKEKKNMSMWLNVKFVENIATLW